MTQQSPTTGEPTDHVLTLWSNDPGLASWADAAGVDRVGLDLEVTGKSERQAGMSTWISDHRIEDFARIAPVMRNASLFARTNALNPASRNEIDTLIELGVTVLMLPSFQEIREVEVYCKIVDGRARVVPLVERVRAISTIPLLPSLGIQEFHVGLNDLSIELGIPQRLGALVSPAMNTIAARARDAELRFGVGGLGKALDTSLPIPSDLVYAQQAHLGSRGAMLARSFFKQPLSEDSIREEIVRLRSRLDHWYAAPRMETLLAHRELARRVQELS